MIEDLRFIEREMTDGLLQWNVKILQAYDGHVWFDVPLIEGFESKEQQK